MDEASFWRLVEDARGEMGADTERVAQALLRRLRTLRPHDLERFQAWWEQAREGLYCWPVIDAATLFLGHLDDEFVVLDWMVSHGRQTMHGVLEDPDRLVALAPDRHNARVDWFCGLTMEAHIAATGAPLTVHYETVDGRAGRDEPYGTAIDLTEEAEVRRRFPRLTAYLDDNRWISRPWES